MFLPWDCPKTNRGLTNHRWIGRVECSHDEGHKIGGYRDGVRESKDLLTVFDGLGGNGSIGNGGQRRIDNHGDGKHSLKVRLIPAGEGAACVGGFELRGSDRVGGASFVFIRAAVEPAEFVVQNSREGQAKGPGPRSDSGREEQSATLKRLVEFDRGGVIGSIVCTKRDC